LLAVYSSGDVARTILIFFLWIAFIGAGIWLVIKVFRNRDVPVWAKALLVVCVVLLPPAGFLVGLAMWFTMRSRSRAAEAETHDAIPEANSYGPAASDALPARPLPFPPHPGSASAPGVPEGSEEESG